MIVESRTRLFVDMLGIELRDERLRDQAVDVRFRLRERPEPRTHARRNDRMVRRHLLVVPCAALDLRVRAARPMRQSRIVAVPEMREDRGRILSLVQRQIFRVRARVCRELLLVELLRRIEHELRLVAVLPAREHLKRRKRKRQPLPLRLLRAMQLRHAPVCRRLGETREARLCRRLVDEPSLAVKPRFLLARLPDGCEIPVCMAELRANLEIIYGLEALDLTLAAHDERQGRRLDPAHGQDELLVPRTACRERIGARKVHADEPVGAGTRQRRLLERVEVAVLAKIRIRLANALLVERVQKDALDGLFVADEVEHLVDQKLPLAVGVARMDDLISTRDEILDDTELPRCRRSDDKLPLGGHDGQILRAPELILLAVLLRLLLAQDMTEAPRHRAFRRFQPAVVRAHRAFEALGNLAPHARFLRNVEPQGFSSFPRTAIFYESPRSQAEGAGCLGNFL